MNEKSRARGLTCGPNAGQFRLPQNFRNKNCVSFKARDTFERYWKKKTHGACAIVPLSPFRVLSEASPVPFRMLPEASPTPPWSSPSLESQTGGSMFIARKLREKGGGKEDQKRRVIPHLVTPVSTPSAKGCAAWRTGRASSSKSRRVVSGFFTAENTDLRLEPRTVPVSCSTATGAAKALLDAMERRPRVSNRLSFLNDVIYSIVKDVQHI